MKIPEYKAQIGAGCILSFFSLLLLFFIIPNEIVFTKKQLGVSPQYYPNLLAGLLFVVSVALGVNGYRSRNKKIRQEYSVTWRETRFVIVTLGVIALQILGFEHIGYLVPAMLAIAACMIFYGHKKYITIAVISVSLPLGIKLFFEKALQVYLP